MKKFKLLLLISILISPIFLEAKEVSMPISKEVMSRPFPKGDFADNTLYMIRLNSKYILNLWYKQKKDFSKQEGQYLDFYGKNEPDIRPTSHNVFVLGFLLGTSMYDKNIAQTSKQEAKKVFMRLLTSVAYRHIANNPDKKNAWGNHWQSAMWAAQVAHGAWFMWDRLPAKTQKMLENMIVHEADRLLKSKVPYFRNKEGEVIYKGDTKAEENAWNSGILTMALNIFPEHKNAKLWYDKNLEYQLSAYATPEDMNSKKLIDGVPMCEILNGNNINSDGTLVNHGRIHPDYMTAIMFNITNAWMDKLANKKPLEASLHNGDLIYKALTQNLYNSKTIYQQDSSSKPTHELYFPQGNDWGGSRQANYWLIDIMADIYHWDAGDKIKAMDFAKVRQIEMLRMMARNSTGEYYQSQAEDNFFSREEWIGQHLVFGYIGLWLKGS